MKVVIIANNSNGLYLFRRQLIIELIKKGNEITVLTPFDSDVDKLRELGTILVETPIDRRGTNPIRDYSLMRLYRKEIKRIRPDLVITYTIKPNVYGGMASRQLKVPYAVNVTGLGTAFEGKGILRKIAIVLNKSALKGAKVVFFENSENRDTFVEEGIVDRSKTHVLHGAGVDLEHFPYMEYPRNDVFRFLFIGRVMKEKGVDELLESMGRLISEGVQCSLDILGNLEEDYKDRLDTAVHDGWLRYYGQQSDVRPFIAACDCFVLPSYHEGMANTNLECASSGRPIITSNIPGCREAVTEGSGLLCEPRDSASLYRVMKRMVDIDREERERMGTVGRNHMENVFDKKKVVSETIGCLLKQ